MSASVLSPQAGLSQFVLSPAVVLTPPITNEDYLVGATVSQTDYLGGAGGVSFDSICGAIEFEYPGIYEITSQIQLSTPADLSGVGASTDGTILMELVGSNGASCLVRNSLYLPVVPASGLSTDGEFCLNAAGIVSVSQSGARVVPGFFTGGITSVGGSNISIDQNATFLLVRRIA